jgi:hypothetical protein
VFEIIGRLIPSLITDCDYCTEDLMAKYEEQLDRVRRYYGRFLQHVEGIAVEMPVRISPEYMDDVYAFFQNCYHLKDWLKNDMDFSKRSDQEIEEFVSTTRSLAICADICNGAKHLVLRRNRSGNIPDFTGTQMTIAFPPKFWQYEFGKEPTVGFKLSLRPKILYGGSVIDAFELATEALEAWESFLEVPCVQ